VSEVLVIMTCKDVADVLRGGGSGWWRVNKSRASRADAVLLLHNAHDRRKAGNVEDHRRPFLVGRIKDVIDDNDGRVSVQFSEIADASGQAIHWAGRNPFTYCAAEILDGLKIDEWKAVPDVSERDAQDYRKTWDTTNLAVLGN